MKSMIYQINASSDAFSCAQTVPKLVVNLLSGRPLSEIGLQLNVKPEQTSRLWMGVCGQT
jgi:hypothetical protein